MNWTSPDHDLALSRSQRSCLAVIFLALLAYLAWRYVSHPVPISNPPSPNGDRATEVADRIDPNTCDLMELAALPGVGEKRARDIIAYRDMAKQRDGAARVFLVREDLLKVRGVGRAMMLQLDPFLIFEPTTRPTTQAY